MAEPDDDQDIDLASLGDEELVAQMHDDLYDGLADEIHEGTTILLERGWSPQKVLDEALVEGMRIVGIDFRDGILFVPEVLLVGQRHEGRDGHPAPAAGRDRGRAGRQGRHRDGEGRHPRHRQEPGGDDAGGRRASRWSTSASTPTPTSFLAALDEHQPDILGMSALLTTTMPYMKVVIDTLDGQGAAARSTSCWSAGRR